MEIILSKKCEQFYGALGKGFGYFIQRRKGRLFSQRSKHPPIPCDGHMRFIFTCAQLARQGTYFSDVKVEPKELKEALREAHQYTAAEQVRPEMVMYHADEIINFKITFGL